VVHGAHGAEDDWSDSAFQSSRDTAGAGSFSAKGNGASVGSQQDDFSDWNSA